MKQSTLHVRLSQIGKPVKCNSDFKTKESFKMKSKKYKKQFNDILIETNNKYCNEQKKFIIIYEICFIKKNHLVQFEGKYIINFKNLDSMISYVKELI